MLTPREQAEFLEHLEAQFVLGKHAPNGFTKNLVGLAGNQASTGFNPVSAGEPGKANVPLVVQFRGIAGMRVVCHERTGEPHLVGIDHDHEVPVINMRGIAGLVLSLKHTGNPGRQAADYLISSIHQKPL